MQIRLKIIIGIIFVFGILIIGRLFELQVLHHNFLGSAVYVEKKTESLVPAKRGKIFIKDDGKLYPIAINENTYNLIISPAEIIRSEISPDEWLDKISPYLDLGLEKSPQQQGQKIIVAEENQKNQKLQEVLRKVYQKKDFYEILKKRISAEEMREIENLKLAGVNFEVVPQRYYPEGEIFSQLVGFVSLPKNCDSSQCSQENGQYGLEEFFNQELSGQSGLVSNSSSEDSLSSNQNVIKEVEDGIDLVLTVDRSIQFFICKTLEGALKEYQASAGTIIVLDSKTSAVLAFCNKPDFNPNKYYDVDNVSLFKNSGIDSVYEPGSIFKVITLASTFDAGKITPQTTYYDYGYVNLDGKTIRNANDRSYGTQTMSVVLEKSINTGAIFAAQSLGRSYFRNYLKKFGFGGLTGIELIGEAAGNIDNLDKKQEIYLATASFGQGISVTPIQMINAIAAIANQGKLMKPYVVDSFIKNGEIIHHQPEFIRQVVSPSTANTINSIMVSTCEGGYGQRAKVKNYYVAGKTGTAQVPRSNGGYSDEVIHSFVGFAPATDPKFVVLVKLDNPQKEKFADSTAAPIFSLVTEHILNYYNIPPDK